MIAQELEVTLHMAFVEARAARHEFITVEHLLSALLDNTTSMEVLKACAVNIDDFSGWAKKKFDNKHEFILVSNEGTNEVTPQTVQAKIDQYKPDIVTMDVNMPKADGVAALKAIMQFDPKAKVVMVTSLEQKHIVQDAMKYGARDYIVKPFEKSRVGIVINKVLRSG